MVARKKQKFNTEDQEPEPEPEPEVNQINDVFESVAATLISQAIQEDNGSDVDGSHSDSDLKLDPRTALSGR